MCLLFIYYSVAVFRRHLLQEKTSSFVIPYPDHAFDCTCQSKLRVHREGSKQKLFLKSAKL